MGMKSNRRKRKYAVDVPDPEAGGATAAADPAQTAPPLAVRITSHGKTSGYVRHINTVLEEAPLRLHAEGAAVCKLVTVVETVKRSGHAGLTASLAVGDGKRGKLPLPAPDSAEEANKRTRGMYGRKLEAQPPPAPAADDDGAASTDGVWMEATLRIA
ncbi:hypothetical protein IWQ57_006875 [Coemansia nantahalensis]|uniref:Uncharacterized protein n=1 Tax=Coemansia nantahalensis TaxID=2789366 RepID=A0ACC1JIG1_9FUNG|nr:hypothetical protein IWQ57_006875 [Coemansia nantahalensis]